MTPRLKDSSGRGEDIQSVQRTSQTVETGSEREVRRAQSATNQVGGVSADVTTLVVRVDGQVQAHQLDEVLVVAKAELVGKVEGVVLVLLDRRHLAVLEDIAVDTGRNGGQLGDEVHRILESVQPVVLLVDTLRIRLGERGLVLKGSHSQGELSHGVQVIGAAVNELLNVLGNVGPSSPFSREVANLLLAGDLARQQQPEETCSWVSCPSRQEGVFQVGLPSGRGSSPPGALGRSFWHSGICELCQRT